MSSAQAKELTVRDVLTIYRKRQRVVYATVLVCGVLGVLLCVLSTRRYEATGGGPDSEGKLRRAGFG